jgi:hypothetical protein
MVKPVTITRNAAYISSPYESNTNCHEASLGTVTPTSEIIEHYRALNIIPDPPAYDSSVKFCYYQFFTDDFQLLGSMNRPALSQPQYRSSFSSKINDLARFGQNSTFHNKECSVFGDPFDKEFYDTQGYAIYPIPGKPTLQIAGNFSLTLNTRALTENQVMEWRIIHSPSGSVDQVSTIQAGSFKMFRKVLIENTTICFLVSF